MHLSPLDLNEVMIWRGDEFYLIQPIQFSGMLLLSTKRKLLKCSVALCV